MRCYVPFFPSFDIHKDLFTSVSLPVLSAGLKSTSLKPWGDILGCNWDKSLKTFAPCYSQSHQRNFTPLYSFIDFFYSNSGWGLGLFTLSLCLHHWKGDGWLIGDEWLREIGGSVGSAPACYNTSPELHANSNPDKTDCSVASEYSYWRTQSSKQTLLGIAWQNKRYSHHFHE